MHHFYFKDSTNVKTIVANFVFRFLCFSFPPPSSTRTQLLLYRLMAGHRFMCSQKVQLHKPVLESRTYKCCPAQSTEGAASVLFTGLDGDESLKQYL